MNFNVIRFDAIGSTNTEAAQQARLGAPEGLCVVANQQTAGRGRYGRSWTSPKDAGLYLSIVLRPRLETSYLPLITLASSIAVHNLMRSLGLNADIKWPNDVLVNEKKISGILAEALESKAGLSVVVGFGINVASSSIAPEIADTATSVEDECGTFIELSEIESLLLKEFDAWYATLSDTDGCASIVNEWSRRSSFSKGKEVTVTLANEIITGVTNGLEPNGSLRVKKVGGETILIQAGDVERVRPIGA